MKNSRIIKAYDSINPSASQKQKMLDVVLQEANLEEAPRKRRKEPVVYTGRPTKTSKRGMMGTIAASLVFLLLSGIILARMLRQPEDNSLTDPVDTVVTGTPYDAVLNKYKTALEEGWSTEQCKTEDICDFITGINFSALDVGYSIIDLDKNGRDELVITNGQGLIWDLYTLLEDETLVQVHCQGDGWPVYRLYENGIICLEDFDPGKVYEYYVYRDGALTGPELSIRQGSGTFKCEAAGKEPYNMSEAEAEAKRAEYKLQELDQISLLSLVSDEVAQRYLLGQYAPVIAKYNRAISEGWSKEQCQIEGISTRFYMPEPIEYTVGYQILDINEDGRDELLVGHNKIIWDLYATLEDGTPIQLLSDEQDGWQYHLCEDQRILCEYYSKDDCYVEYYWLEDHQLVMDQQLQYQDGQWQIQKAGEDWQSISEQEVQDLTNSIKIKTPDWIPLTPQVDTEALEYYMLTLEKYKTALLEDWDPGVCMENGISLMVGYYGDFVTDLGYALMDLDGNGIQELIITDGTNIFDLYTMVDNSPVQVFSAMERIQYYLTEDGYICCMGSGGAARSYYVLYELEGCELRYLEGFAFDADTDPSNPWFYYDGNEFGDPCDTEIAEERINIYYQIQRIPFTSFE